MFGFSINKARLVLHLLLCLPLLWLGYLIATQQLGADPAELLVRELGFYGACVLWGCLAMTPLRVLTEWPGWIAFRRLLGLWSFFYLTLHFSVFIMLWAGLNLAVIMDEVTQRPYIIVGLIAWLMMLPLAITSTRGFRRRLGKRWQKLHRLVYLVALLGLLHIVWVAKLEYMQPLLFAGILIAMFALRIKSRKSSPASKIPSTLA